MNVSKVLVAGLVLATLAMVFTSACGDDDADSAGKSTDGSSPAAASPGATASGASQTGGSTSEPAKSPTAAKTVNAAADFDAASTAFKDGTYKLAYEMTTTDKAGKSTSGSMTMERKPPKSYFKAENLGGSSGTIIVIDDGTNSYVCTESPVKICLKATTGGSNGLGNVPSFRPDDWISTTKVNSKAEVAPDQTIAGRSAKCYRVKDGASEGTTCLDKKTGLVLLVDTTSTDGSKLKLQAKEVADSANDADFNPPYTVQSLPSLPGR